MRRALFLGLFLTGLATTTIWAAGAPAGRYSVGSDTVYDNKTGLTWQRNPPFGPNDTFSQSGSADYCSWLGKTQKLGGYSNWRLPSKKELETLVDVRAINPSIDSVAFPSTPSETFWTSSAYAGYASFAWVVDFNIGGIYKFVTSSTSRVRCVR